MDSKSVPKATKTRSGAPKVRSVALEARYVAPLSCPVPPEAGVVTVAGTVAAVAVAVAGVVAVTGTVTGSAGAKMCEEPPKDMIE